MIEQINNIENNRKEILDKIRNWTYRFNHYSINSTAYTANEIIQQPQSISIPTDSHYVGTKTESRNIFKFWKSKKASKSIFTNDELVDKKSEVYRHRLTKNINIYYSLETDRRNGNEYVILLDMETEPQDVKESSKVADNQNILDERRCPNCQYPNPVGEFCLQCGARLI